jgi:hypothetical protein
MTAGGQNRNSLPEVKAPTPIRVSPPTANASFTPRWRRLRSLADEQRRLGTEVRHQARRKLAPSGKSIVFINTTKPTRDLDAGKERLVTPKTWERCGVPAFSPDGQRVAVASRTGNIGIFLLSSTGVTLPQDRGSLLHAVLVEGRQENPLPDGERPHPRGRHRWQGAPTN